MRLFKDITDLLIKGINVVSRNVSKNVKVKPFYDNIDAIKFIQRETGMDAITIKHFMDADLRYQKALEL